MPITIKELFPSDPLSEALEKINFNFDQLILAGGGPPGPAGPIGPQGVPGPLGKRGDHWFVGASALGQTADHDGGSLKVEDHFLDSLGDVYSYFDISGSTGWTASGVNLKGPIGPTGNTGGSDDVLIRAGGSGNAVTPSTNGYGPQASSTPTALIDFWIPKNMGKNSVFVGDADWAVNFLQNFGSNSSALTDQNSVPQISIIQKNTNQSALNGLMIGTMGGGYGATSNALPEGGTGSTTSAFDFVHFAFGKPFVGGAYDKMFRVKSFKQKFRIEVGGNGSNEVLTDLQLASRQFSWINNTDGQFISGQTKQGIVSYSLQLLTGLTGSGIEMFSKPDWSNSYATQKYGIIGFQTVQGTPPSFPNFNPAHGYGNVHIGATSNATLSYGTRTQQALGITRPIGYGSGNNDSAIRFFGSDFPQAGNEWSSIIGGIRPFTQTITNTSGTSDIRAIQIGAGRPVTGNPTPQTQSRQIGGRVGINNHPGWNDYNSARTVNFPVHINLTGFQVPEDKATSAYPGQTPLSVIEQWAFGVDYDRVAGETGSWHAGWDTDSPGFGIAYGYGYTAATGGTTWTTRPLVLNSYYAGTATNNVMTGRRNPNLYLQLGRDGSIGNTGDGGFGNIGLGFTPNWNTPGKWVDAWSKLSINGGITIGGADSGWHEQNDLRPFMGISLQGAIFQGSTGSTGLFATAYFGPSGINTATGNLIKITSDGVIMGDKIVARGLLNQANLNNVPHISLPDLRTGLSMYANQPGRGYFTVPSTVLGGGTYGSGPTSGSTDVAYSSIDAQEFFNPAPAPAFVMTKRVVHATSGADTRLGKVYTLTDLYNRGFKTVHSFTYPSGSLLAGQTRRRCWLPVPSDNSTVVLDFSRGVTSLWGWVGATWTAPPTPGLNKIVESFLDGSSVEYDTTVYPGYAEKIPTSSFAPRTFNKGQWGLTIDPGRYEGQQLTIIIKDVDLRNAINGIGEGGGANNPGPFFHADNFVRFRHEDPLRDLGGQLPLPVNAAPSAASITGTIRRDFLVMARDLVGPETLTSPSGTTWKEYPSNLAAIGIGLGATGSAGSFNLPYGSPNGSVSTPFTVTAIGYTAALTPANLANDNSQSGIAGWYTDNDYTRMSPGTGGTLLLGNGWKVINFVWLRDYSDGGTRGAWVETGREVITPRGARRYGSTGGSTF
jgi:hypothetical protein